MNRKPSLSILIVMCFFLLNGSFPLLLTEPCGASGKEIYVDDDFYFPRDGTAEHPYQTITQAMNLADEGDTIYVFGGSYNETLTINKRLSLIGGIDDGPSVISYGREHMYTVDIKTDFVTLENFTIIDSKGVITSIFGALLHVTSDNVIIQKNNITECVRWGIYLESSDDNTLVGNFVNETKGVYLLSSDNNVFSDNIIANSTDNDIKLLTSTNNIIHGNRIETSNYGIYARECTKTNISSNTILGNYYHGVFLFRGRDAEIWNNAIKRNAVSGIHLDVTDSSVTENTIDNNDVGIMLQESDCELSGNIIKNCSSLGLSAAAGSRNNIIYNNYFQSNDVNAREQGSNYWYYGTIGNSWDDYQEIDRNLDGIGDTPYIVPTGGQDRYPLGIFLKPPIKPSNPYPADDQENVGLKITLKVRVIDRDSDLLKNVSFFNALDDSYIGHAQYVPSGSNASCQLTLAFDTTFAWYAIANDSQLENRSAIWFFTTKQRPPENKKPVADAGGPYIAKIGQTVSFDGSGSSDPDGRLIFYRWNFGDGSSEILDETPTHIYSDPGIYTVTLTVVDDDGRSSMMNTTATISGDILLNSPPVAVVAPLSSIEVNQLVTFNASGSYDVDGSIVGYRWNFDNDEVYDTAWLETGITTHTFSTAQTAVVTLEVKDNGNSTSTFSTSVTVVAAEKKTPGFEIVFVFLALGSCLLLYRKQRK